MRAPFVVAWTAPLWLCACVDSAPASSSAAGGSSGATFNVPAPTGIDCDAAPPSENLAPPATIDPLCDPSARAASFASDVAPISAACAGEVCHLPWTYDSLVGVRSTACCDKRLLVNPYLPSESALIQALRGTNPCVGQMPPGAPLGKAEIDSVIAWIYEGAQRN